MFNSKLNRRAALGTALAAGTITAAAGTAHATPAGGRRGTEQQSASGRIYELSHHGQTALVGGVAATLLSWQVDGTELLLTHDPDSVGEGYQGKTILPWPNRIDHGTYTFGGTEYTVPINEPDRDTALHGLLSFTEWQPVRHSHDRLVLEIQQHPTYGYPFHLAFRLEYALGDGGVSSALTARNIGNTAAPFGTANHTYIAAPEGSRINDMSLELNADTYYIVNDRLIPTATAPVAGTEYDFRDRRQIGGTVMDTAFKGLSRDDGGLARVSFTRPGDHDVELLLDSAYGYLQVYTDDAPDAHQPRSGVTVEPVSCAPDAFNSGDGLTVLAPGQQWQGTWRLQTVK